jgi:hypothetical protein
MAGSRHLPPKRRRCPTGSRRGRLASAFAGLAFARLMGGEAPIDFLAEIGSENPIRGFRLSLRRREPAIVARARPALRARETPLTPLAPIRASPAIALLLLRCRAPAKARAPTDMRASGGSVWLNKIEAGETGVRPLEHVPIELIWNMLETLRPVAFSAPNRCPPRRKMPQTPYGRERVSPFPPLAKIASTKDCSSSGVSQTF